MPVDNPACSCYGASVTSHYGRHHGEQQRQTERRDRHAARNHETGQGGWREQSGQGVGRQHHSTAQGTSRQRSQSRHGSSSARRARGNVRSASASQQESTGATGHHHGPGGSASRQAWTSGALSERLGSDIRGSVSRDTGGQAKGQGARSRAEYRPKSHPVGVHARRGDRVAGRSIFDPRRAPLVSRIQSAARRTVAIPARSPAGAQ